MIFILPINKKLCFKNKVDQKMRSLLTLSFSTTLFILGLVLNIQAFGILKDEGIFNADSICNNATDCTSSICQFTSGTCKARFTDYFAIEILGIITYSISNILNIVCICYADCKSQVVDQNRLNQYTCKGIIAVYTIFNIFWVTASILIIDGYSTMYYNYVNMFMKMSILNLVISIVNSFYCRVVPQSDQYIEI